MKSAGFILHHHHHDATIPHPLPPVLHRRTGLFHLYHLGLLGSLHLSPMIPPPKTFNRCIVDGMASHCKLATSSRLQDGRQDEDQNIAN